MTDNRVCKATIYSESPDLMIPRKVKHMIMPRDPNELGTAVGHVFFGITDKNGVEKVYGLHAVCAMVGNDNVPPEDRMGPIFSTRKVAGCVADDSKEPYDDKLVYNITEEQYKKIEKFAEDAKANPPKYNILTNNCVCFAYNALRQAEVKLPPQLPVYTPGVTSLHIRALDVAQTTKKNLGLAAAKILKQFPPTRSVSEKILEDIRKKPSMEGHGVTSVVKLLKSTLNKKYGRF